MVLVAVPVPVAPVVSVLVRGAIIHRSRAEQAAHERKRRMVVCYIIGGENIGVCMFAVVFVGFVGVLVRVVCMHMSVIVLFVMATVFVTVVMVVAQGVVSNREAVLVSS